MIHQPVGYVLDIPGIPGRWDGKDSGIECGMGVLSDTLDSGLCLVGITGLWDWKENDVVKVWDITGILGKVIVNLDKSAFLMRRHVCTHKLTSSGGLLI